MPGVGAMVAPQLGSHVAGLLYTHAPPSLDVASTLRGSARASTPSATAAAKSGAAKRNILERLSEDVTSRSEGTPRRRGSDSPAAVANAINDECAVNQAGSPKRRGPSLCSVQAEVRRGRG